MSKFARIMSVVGLVFLIAGVTGLVNTFTNSELTGTQWLYEIIKWSAATANGLIITSFILYRLIIKR